MSHATKVPWPADLGSPPMSPLSAPPPDLVDYIYSFKPVSSRIVSPATTLAKTGLLGSCIGELQPAHMVGESAGSPTPPLHTAILAPTAAPQPVRLQYNSPTCSHAQNCFRGGKLGNKGKCLTRRLSRKTWPPVVHRILPLIPPRSMQRQRFSDGQVRRTLGSRSGGG